MAEHRRVALEPVSPITTSLKDFCTSIQDIPELAKTRPRIHFPISPEDVQMLQMNCPFKRTKFTETFMDLPGYPLAKINCWLKRKETEDGSVSWSLNKPLSKTYTQIRSAKFFVAEHDQFSQDILASINAALHTKLQHLYEICIFIGEMTVIRREFQMGCTIYVDEVKMGKDDFYSIATLEIHSSMDEWTVPKPIQDFFAKPFELAPVRSQVIEHIFLYDQELYSELAQLYTFPDTVYNPSSLHSKEPPFSASSQEFIRRQTMTLERLNAQIEELNELDTDDEDDDDFFVELSKTRCARAVKKLPT